MPKLEQLIAALKDKNVDIRTKAALDLNNFEAAGLQSTQDLAPLIKALSDPVELVRFYAAEGLGNLRSAAKPALEPLRQLLSDEEVYLAAHVALLKIDPPAPASMAALIQALGASSPDTRWYAAYSLGEIGAESGPAVEALFKTLSDTEAEVRLAAAEALDKINPANRVTASSLMQTLADEHENVEARFYAVKTLGDMGLAAQPAVGALTQALSDQDSDVRFFAADALGKIGEGLAPAVEPLIEKLSDPDYKLRQVAAKTLGRIGDRRALPDLEKLAQVEAVDFYTMMTKRAALEAIEKIKSKG